MEVIVLSAPGASWLPWWSDKEELLATTPGEKLYKILWLLTQLKIKS